MEITVVVHQEGRRFWSEINELPGCFATAGTLSELHEALADAVGLYLWDMPARIPDEPLAVGETTMQVMPAPPGGKAPGVSPADAGAEGREARNRDERP